MNITHPVASCANISDAWQSLLCTRCGLAPLPSQHQELLEMYHHLQPVFNTLAFVLSLLSLVGNFLVILTSLADRQNHNMADLFLFNVAIASVFYSGVNIIGEALFLVQGQTILEESCVIQPLTSLRVLTFTVSIYSLLAVSIDRYLATTVFSANCTGNRKATVLVLLWLVSLAVTLPLCLCDFTFNIPYIICLAIIILCLPLLGVLMFNILICKSARTQVGPSSPHREVRSKRTVPLVTALVLSLVVFWMGYLVMLSYPAIIGSVFSCRGYIRFLLASRAVNILAYVNPVINPVLYCVFSRKFRQGFQSIHRFSCPCLFDPQ